MDIIVFHKICIWLLENGIKKYNVYTQRVRNFETADSIFTDLILLFKSSSPNSSVEYDSHDETVFARIETETSDFSIEPQKNRVMNDEIWFYDYEENSRKLQKVWKKHE